MKRKNIPIVICGGGSVGLSLAAELGWRGINCLAVEQADRLNPHPRANAVANRTMEYYRRWGIDEKIVRAGVPPDHPADYYWISRFQGKLLFKVSLPPAKKMEKDKSDFNLLGEEYTWSPYLKTITGQNELEIILHEYVKSLDCVDFQLSKKLLDFTQDEKGVTCILEDQKTGDCEEVRCKYLLACDGGKSTVREKLGFKLSGRADLAQFVSFYFRAPKFMECHKFGPANIYFPLHADHAGFILNWDVGTTFTYHRILKKGESWDQIDPTEAIQNVLGAKTNIELISTQPWSAHALVSERYHKGRVFLAGDAAHLFTPTGGFGMNTGVSDAIDLAWKIEAAIKGWGGRYILDSYFEERHAIGVRNTLEAANCFDELKNVMKYGDELESESQDSIEFQNNLRKNLKNQLKLISSSGTLLGYRYSDSKIVVPDGTAEPVDDPRKYKPIARPGHRAPHVWLGKGVSLLDKLGSHFTLICFVAIDQTVRKFKESCDQTKFPITILEVRDSDALEIYESNYCIIRPDLMVAWRGQLMPEDSLEVIDRIRGANSQEP